MNCNRKLKGEQRKRRTAGQQFLMDFSTIWEAESKISKQLELYKADVLENCNPSSR